MKILHVLDHSLPVQSGYAFRSAAILREQRKLGWETVQVTGPKQGDAAESIEHAGDVSYHRTASRHDWLGRLPLGNQIGVVRALRERLRRLIHQEQPDIIHAHSPCLNALAALGLGPPLVYEMRSSWEDAAVSTGTTTEGSVRYRVSKALETYVLRRADAVTTICDGLRKEVIGRGVPAARVTIIPNAVEMDALVPRNADSTMTRRALGLEGSAVLGFIGSFFAWEGLALLIEAMPLILAKRPDARLLLVGTGIHEPVLRRLTAEFDLSRQVRFAGQVPHARVTEMYSAIDVLVYPRLPMRLTEMVTPLKPIEAMALGKALIASDVGGHRELIRHRETGLLFRAGDVTHLSATVLKLLHDSELRGIIGQNGRDYVTRERVWAKVVPQYMHVYLRASASRQGHQ